jgi:hypothetical protein
MSQRKERTFPYFRAIGFLWSLLFSRCGFVSDFEIRISGFLHPLHKWKNRFRDISGTLIIALLGVLIGGCAAFRVTPAGPPLTDPEVEQAVSMLQRQETEVTSFYKRGVVLARSWAGEEEANIVIAGSKVPFRIKIEVTHSWGQPILHILIDRGRLQALSFSESTLYVGDFTPEALSRFLPGPLTRELIWSALRGYPTVSPHRKSSSPQANRIELIGSGGEKVQVIDLGQDDMHPQRVSFPAQQVSLIFSDVVEQNGIFHAREVEVDHKKARGRLVIRNEKTVFNRTMPDEVFTIDKPPGFSEKRLEER